ncbi:MAG: D-glycero-beta-D-manno-heptose 1-phosphate adenylyltransferase [Candidatus Woesearchaeota archaeon]
MGKIVSREELAKIVLELKKQGKKIVTTNGAFDILHIGHIRSLQQAKSFGDVLIVGVNSDSSIKQYKSDKRPINPENDRAEMLAALECVDYVTIFTETTPCELLELIKPDIHVKSGYKPEEMPETEVVRKNKGEIRIVPLVAGKSTTNIIRKICDVYG